MFCSSRSVARACPDSIRWWRSLISPRWAATKMFDCSSAGSWRRKAGVDRSAA
ncbi:hypothetical protein BGW80DRAFT_1334793 [Lactifluus volemus]|nr:hypothetical protein BGW80DRAFT_1334793 [Lactifluus volemus]